MCGFWGDTVTRIGVKQPNEFSCVLQDCIIRLDDVEGADV